MPVSKLFLPQAMLEEWALGDKADLKDGKLVIAQDKSTYPVTPAVHFVKLVSGSDDRKLIAKVKSEEQLQKLGAEHLAESVILGETAYEVVSGYLTDVPSPAPAKPAPKKGANPEADLLAAFILDKFGNSGT